jgi:lipid A disaccharide synthetase
MTIDLVTKFCLYFLNRGAGSRRRRRNQTRDRVDLFKNEKYLLVDPGSRTSQVQKQLFTTRSSCVDDAFEKKSDPNCARLSSTMNSKTNSVDFISSNDTTTDTHVTVLRPSQAEMPTE